MVRLHLTLLFLTALTLRGAEHLGPVTDILVVDDQVLTASQAGVLVGTGKSLGARVQPAFRVSSLARLRRGGDSPDLLLFAGGTPGLKGMLGSIATDPTTNESSRQFDLSRDLLYDLAVSPNGKWLAVAGADGMVHLARSERIAHGTWTARHRHTAAARTVAFSPDGKWLASAGLDGVVMISVVEAREAPRQLLDHTAGVECLAWSADSARLATGSRDSKVRLHDVSGKLIRTYTGLGMENEPVAGRVPSRVLSLAWSKEVLVAGTSKGFLYRLSPSDDTTRKIERPGTSPVYALAFRSGASLLIGGHSRIGELRIKP